MAAQTPTVLAARRARPSPSQVAHDSDREMNASGSPTRMLVRHLHHTGEQRQVNDLQQPARKIEPRGVHRILRWRCTVQWCSSSSESSSGCCCELRVVDAHRAATDERPEPREEPKSGRRRKLTRCLRGIACNQEFMAHGEGEGRRSVSACSQRATQGRVKARRIGRCVRTLPR